MSRPMRYVATTLVLGAAGAGLFFYSQRAGAKAETLTTVPVERGDIVEKALAVGQIVPDQEVQVKSQISGIVATCFVEVGDRVEVGQPLFTISPDPTPLELSEAERRVELAQVAYEKTELDLTRSRSLWSSGILARDQFDSRQKEFDQARIALEQERDRLALLKEGRIRRASGGVDSVIRASAAGTVLERRVNPGDPVVPLTTFQEGTVLMTLADMGTLEFQGTVDEIDVGKLHEGMPARIQVGALPGSAVTATLSRIAPKAREKEGATVFDVELALDEDETGVALRAGYSANADIVIQEKSGVLLVAERLVTLEQGRAFVEVPAPEPGAEPVRREIEVGLSDGLNLEVIAGLAEGESVIQRPPKKIE
ncbi:MAG TPA: efflux RND transporter periplasmic adaptor subunit [Thermoanaerobaculia bacterium]|nr:efflux RND transporter periplasmic adaptor subunit [Thermoanaerobaculia bacterium]